MDLNSYRTVALAGAIGALLAMSPQSGSAAPRACVAVFDFELVDSSLDGQVYGVKAEELQRLQLLSNRLRTWVDASSGWKSCTMTPVESEAKAANLSACGCVSRLARSVGGKLAVVSAVHKVSNLILNIRIDVFDAETGVLLIQQNADIRSNSDTSWQRGLDWLIKHRLAAAFANIREAE